MTYKRGATPSSTLAAIQARQHALEQQLKEDSREVAVRVIEQHGTRKEWPEGDMDEVLYALGLKEWTK